MLATFAQPAPPMLVFGLAAAVGFCVMFIRAALAGTAAGFVGIRPATMLFVATGLFANNLLYLLAMPRIGPAEANVIAYLRSLSPNPAPLPAATAAPNAAPAPAAATPAPAK